MQHFRCHLEHRVTLVAKSADIARDGGMVFFEDGQKTTAKLDRHILVGDMPAAVWRSHQGHYLLVGYDENKGELVVMSRMTSRALAQFTDKKGIYWTLPN